MKPRPSVEKAFNNMPTVFSADMFIAKVRDLSTTGVALKDGNIMRMLRQLRLDKVINYQANKKSTYKKLRVE